MLSLNILMKRGPNAKLICQRKSVWDEIFIMSKSQVEKNSKADYFNANWMRHCTLVHGRDNYTANTGFARLHCGRRRGKQEKSNAFRFSQKKCLLKSKTKWRWEKNVKNMHFRKLSLKQVLKFTLKSSNSHNKNERSEYHKLITSVKQSGKQVADTRLGRVFLNWVYLR